MSGRRAKEMRRQVRDVVASQDREWRTEFARQTGPVYCSPHTQRRWLRLVRKAAR